MRERERGEGRGERENFSMEFALKEFALRQIVEYGVWRLLLKSLLLDKLFV